MHPHLWPPLPVSTYGLCISLGLIASWFLARSLAASQKVDLWKIDYFVTLVAFIALLGATVAGLVEPRTPAPVGESNTSLVLVGAMILGTATGAAWALLTRLPLGLLADLLAAPLMIAVAFGRLGCFFAGCCWGKVCPVPNLGICFPQNSFAWYGQLHRGIIYPADPFSLPVFPTQLLESLAAVLLAALCLHRFRTRRISGEIFLTMALTYCTARFALEFLRADNPPLAGFFHWMTFSQLATAALFLLALLTFLTFLIRRRHATAWNLRLPRASATSVPSTTG